MIDALIFFTRTAAFLKTECTSLNRYNLLFFNCISKTRRFTLKIKKFILSIYNHCNKRLTTILKPSTDNDTKFEIYSANVRPNEASTTLSNVIAGKWNKTELKETSERVRVAFALGSMSMSLSEDGLDGFDI